MTTETRWVWRAFWALAACAWLAILPALAADAGARIRDGASVVVCKVEVGGRMVSAVSRALDLMQS